MNVSRQFEGWYYKHQTHGKQSKSLAVIPGKSADSAFVLVITDCSSYHITYPLSSYNRHNNCVYIGDNIFSSSGIQLDIRNPQLTLTGDIAYTNLSSINGDIMGPFKFFPMECRHGIISMDHQLTGTVILNGEKYNFDGGRGYIECDSGRSFPKWYTWAHCNAFERDCSIMVSVANIPFYGISFCGCICVVLLEGREYRLATYKGVKILKCTHGFIELKQGPYKLQVTFNDTQTGQVLPAPHLGKMSRSIREAISCTARFRFMKKDTCLFDEESNLVSYEYSNSI